MMKPLYAINKFRYNSVHDIVCKKAKKRIVQNPKRKRIVSVHMSISGPKIRYPVGGRKNGLCVWIHLCL